MEDLMLDEVKEKDGYTYVFAVSWDFDCWTDYGLLKIKGIYETHDEIIDLILDDSPLVEDCDYKEFKSI